jgi:hypothetical protein
MCQLTLKGRRLNLPFVSFENTNDFSVIPVMSGAEKSYDAVTPRYGPRNASHSRPCAGLAPTFFSAAAIAWTESHRVLRRPSAAFRTQ